MELAGTYLLPAPRRFDSGSLKSKLGSSIVAISSIRLLQRFLEANTPCPQRQALRADRHAPDFVVSALLLTYIDRIAAAKKVDADH